MLNKQNYKAMKTKHFTVQQEKLLVKLQELSHIAISDTIKDSIDQFGIDLIVKQIQRYVSIEANKDMFKQLQLDKFYIEVVTEINNILNGEYDYCTLAIIDSISIKLVLYRIPFKLATDKEYIENFILRENFSLDNIQYGIVFSIDDKRK